ncbi:MAG: hypothetical protein JO104_07020, partial [Candidatus Eremiobacteraeota bacterium]|nr:hypothetical protein [Candidatus Eremiobacteraeota bacterium]
MTNAPLRLFWTAAAAALLAACSRGAPAPSMLPASGGSTTQTIQQNNGSNWVTLSNTYMMGDTFAIVPGKNVLYYSANFGTGSDQDPQTIGTMQMNGVPLETYDSRLTCGYGSISFLLYFNDFVFNHEGYTVMTNVGSYHSTSAMLWSFVSADGTEIGCHALVGQIDGASGFYPMALGPNDTIWAVGQTAVWRFSKNGDAKPIVSQHAGYISLIVEGPDGVMWGDRGGPLLRIDPKSGSILNTYKPPSNCAYPSSIAAIKGLLWGLAGNCIFSVTTGGTFTAYQVNPAGAEQ